MEVMSWLCRFEFDEDCDSRGFCGGEFGDGAD